MKAGHIRKRQGKRGTTWYLVVDVGFDEDGKRKQKWQSFDTRREAQEARTEILHRLKRGTYVQPSKLTFRSFIETEWLPAVEGTLRASTFASYASNLRHHVIPAIGATRLQDVTPAMLNKLYGDLGDHVKPATVRYIHTITRRALADAVMWDRLARNPADRAMPPKPSAAKPPPMRTWTREQLRAFLEHVSDDRLSAAWRFAAATGSAAASYSACAGATSISTLPARASPRR